MSWILLSISAAIIWALINVLDKFILTKWAKKSLIPVIIFGLVALITSLGIYFFIGFSSLSLSHLILAIGMGFIYTLFGSVFYYRAVQSDEVSRIVPLLNFGPLFTLIFATIFLNEYFLPHIYLGIILLVFGAILISTRKRINFKFNKAFWFANISILAYSVEAVVIKYLIGFTDFWTIFGYLEIGSFLGSIPIFFLISKDFKQMIRSYGFKPIIAMTFSETFSLIGLLLITIAYTTGSVTLVNALSSLQSFFVLLLMIILSLFFPYILKEEIKTKTILLKLVAIILMFVGVILIT